MHDRFFCSSKGRTSSASVITDFIVETGQKREEETIFIVKLLKEILIFVLEIMSSYENVQYNQYFLKAFPIFNHIFRN